LIVDDLRRNPRRDPESYSNFTVEFMIRVRDHVQQDLPLAFPAAVAEIYLSNPHAGHAMACKQCGYKLPFHLFTSCPVCDAKMYS